MAEESPWVMDYTPEGYQVTRPRCLRCAYCARVLPAFALTAPLASRTRLQYWFNQVTGESSWYPPEESTPAPPQASVPVATAEQPTDDASFFESAAAGGAQAADSDPFGEAPGAQQPASELFGGAAAQPAQETFADHKEDALAGLDDLFGAASQAPPPAAALAAPVENTMPTGGAAARPAAAP